MSDMRNYINIVESAHDSVLVEKGMMKKAAGVFGAAALGTAGLVGGLAAATSGPDTSASSEQIALKKMTPEQLDNSSQPVQSCEFGDMLIVMDGIQTVSAMEASDICRYMTNEFGGLPPIKALRGAAKAASIIQIDQIQRGDQVDPIYVGKLLTDIAVARGQSNADDIYNTFDIVIRAYNAFDGQITPRTILAFLKSSGPAAKTLSDDGLVHMISVIHNSQ